MIDQGLVRITAEIVDDAEKLLVVGIDRQVGRNRLGELDAGIGIDRQDVLHLLQQNHEGDRPAAGRRLRRLPVGQNLAGIADGAVDGAQQFRRKTFDQRILGMHQPVGHQLRRSQDVAHVVVDLRDGEAEIGKVLLLLQGFLQLGLHGGEMTAGNRQFVPPLLGDHHPFWILRTFGKGLHAVGQPPDGADHDPVDGEEDQRRGDQRDQDRQDQHVAGIVQHGLAQTGIGHDDLDHHVAFADRAEDADGAVATEQQRFHRILHRRQLVHVGDVVLAVHLRGNVRCRQQLRRAVLAQHDRLGAGGHQRVVLDAARQFGRLQAVDDHGGGGGRVEPVFQPAQAHRGDRRRKDQHFRQHHENDGQPQQLAGKAGEHAAQPALDAGARDRAFRHMFRHRHLRHPLPPQPRRARNRIKDRSQGFCIRGLSYETAALFPISEKVG